MNEKIEELKSVIDQLTLQVAWLTANQNILKKMVLGVYQDTLPKEQAEAVISKFYLDLEKEVTDSLNKTSVLLFDETGRTLRRELFDSFEFFRNREKGI